MWTFSLPRLMSPTCDVPALLLRTDLRVITFRNHLGCMCCGLDLPVPMVVGGRVKLGPRPWAQMVPGCIHMYLCTWTHEIQPREINPCQAQDKSTWPVWLQQQQICPHPPWCFWCFALSGCRQHISSDVPAETSLLSWREGLAEWMRNFDITISSPLTLLY